MEQEDVSQSIVKPGEKGDESRIKQYADHHNMTANIKCEPSAHLFLKAQKVAGKEGTEQQDEPNTEGTLLKEIHSREERVPYA